MEKFSEAVLRFQNIHKIHSSDGVNFVALEKINFTIHKGEFIGLSGKSGSGKTSLLNVADSLTLRLEETFLLKISILKI